ncbi:MAG: helix-turn-helix transcriptional regulator [Vicinamibacterales bacterium]
MPSLTSATALVLDALARGYRHGFDILDATGLPSGTVYPILRRLEEEALAGSRWEDAAKAQRDQRPPRRYYELTRAGLALAEQARRRYPMLAGLPSRAKTRRA